MTVTYDPEVDALYVTFCEAEVARSSNVEEGVVLDYDAEDRLVGIEVLRASTRTDDPASIHYALATAAPTA